MNWLNKLPGQQPLTLILAIITFVIRYVVLDFLANSRNFYAAMMLVTLLFPETFFVPAVLEPKGWSETSIAFWMYVMMLITSYIGAMLFPALCRAFHRFHEEGP